MPFPIILSFIDKGRGDFFVCKYIWLDHLSVQESSQYCRKTGFPCFKADCQTQVLFSVKEWKPFLKKNVCLFVCFERELESKWRRGREGDRIPSRLCISTEPDAELRLTNHDHNLSPNQELDALTSWVTQVPLKTSSDYMRHKGECMVRNVRISWNSGAGRRARPPKEWEPGTAQSLGNSRATIPGPPRPCRPVCYLLLCNNLPQSLVA